LSKVTQQVWEIWHSNLGIEECCPYQYMEIIRRLIKVHDPLISKCRNNGHQMTMRKASTINVHQLLRPRELRVINSLSKSFQGGKIIKF
jgi:hypothetical protein